MTSRPNSSAASERPVAEPSLWLRIVDLFAPPLDPEAGEEHRRQGRTTVVFLFIGITIIFGFSLLNLQIGNLVPAVVEQLTTAILILMLFAIRRGHVRLGAHIGILATAITIYLAMWYGGGMAAAAVVFLPMLPAIGLLSIGKAGGIAGLIQALVIVVLVAGAEKLGFEPPYSDPADKLFVKRTAEAIVVVIEIWALCLAFFNLKDEAFGLLQASRDEIASLLNNMRQGVLAFDKTGRVVGRHSEQAKVVFGRDSLEDAGVLDLLYPNVPEYDVERQQFAAWLENLPAVDGAAWDEFAQLAPARCVRHQDTPQEQHLALEFRPIFQQEKLSRVMLLVTDETETIQLKRAADEERAARNKAIHRMRRIAAGGAYAFLAFLRTAEKRINEIRDPLASDHGRALQLGDIDDFFHQAHTIKGEARLYDLDELERLMTQAEDVLRQLRNRTAETGFVRAPDDVSLLHQLVSDGLEQIEKARADLVAASPIGTAILDQVTVSRNDLATLRTEVQVAHRSLGDAVKPIARVTDRLASRLFGELTNGLIDGVQRWSEQRSKRAEITIEGKEVPVRDELADMLPGVLTHLVRNAVAHGVETPDERLKAGKPEVGAIRVECAEAQDGLRVVVEDDGSGIQLDRLVSVARERGISEQPSLELVFVDGLSVSETTDALSGQGMGMGAVRAMLDQMGYDIHVESEPGRGTRLTLRPQAPQISTKPLRAAGAQSLR